MKKEILKGTYCLIIEVKEDKEIKIGAIGEIRFKKGIYIYVGSAMNSLKARIARHKSENKKLHWHVDYLLNDESAKIVEVLYKVSDKKLECDIANSLSLKSENKITDFGCSDCKCDSHLFYFSELENALKITENMLKINN